MPLEPILACMPVELTEAERAPADRVPGGPFVPYKGSIQRTCCQCGRAVWVGPTQQQYAAQGVKVWCMTCAVPIAGPVWRLTDKQWGQ